LQDRSVTNSLGILKKQHKRNKPGGSISFRLCLFLFCLICNLIRLSEKNFCSTKPIAWYFLSIFRLK
jgi:hypothetical protein